MRKQNIFFLLLTLLFLLTESCSEYNPLRAAGHYLYYEYSHIIWSSNINGNISRAYLDDKEWALPIAENLDNPGSVCVDYNPEYPTSIDVFYVDEQKVYRMDLFSNLDIIPFYVSTQPLRDICFDADQDMLYIAVNGSQKQIIRSNTNNNVSEVILDADISGPADPGAIAIDPERDMLVIIDGNNIGISDRGGNDYRLLKSGLIHQPEQVTLDWSRGELYYSYNIASAGYVAAISYISGAEPAVLRTLEPDMFDISDVCIDNQADMLYISNEGHIYSLALAGGEDIVPVIGRFESITSITILP